MATNKPKGYIIHLKWKGMPYPDGVIGEACVTMGTALKLKQKFVNEVHIVIYDTTDRPLLSYKRMEKEIIDLYNKKFPPLTESKVKWEPEQTSDSI